MIEGEDSRISSCQWRSRRMAGLQDGLTTTRVVKQRKVGKLASQASFLWVTTVSVFVSRQADR